MPVSFDEFVRLLAASRLMSAADIARFQAESPHSLGTADADVLARALVAAGRLTPYQATALSEGQADGLVLGNYVVLDKIGAGGMGEVLKARHQRMDRIVALKVLPRHLLDTPAALRRFHREVKAAARLNHPNIVTAFDADEADGIHYLVMEYVDGNDLAALVKQHGPLPVADAVHYVIQAARGLAYAHQRDVIHRDIKPNNLLLGSDGVVKVLDMGLARVDQDTTTEGHASTAVDGDDYELTHAGQMMGTVNYMAPEQAADTRAADARSDIYSLGCTLFRLLTGKPVFGGDTREKRLAGHCQGPIPSLRGYRKDVSDSLDAVFQKMVAKSAEDRYQSMNDLIAALELLDEGAPVPPPVAPKSSEAVVAPPPPPPPAENMPAVTVAPPPVAESQGGALASGALAAPAADAVEAEVIPEPPPLPSISGDTVNIHADQDTSVSVPHKLRRSSARGAAKYALSWLGLVGIIAAGWVIFGYAIDMKNSTSQGSSEPPRTDAPGGAGAKDARLAHMPPRPSEGPSDAWTDLLPLVDLTRDAHDCAWSFSDDAFYAPGGKRCRATIPITPDGSYELRVDFTRTAGKGEVNVMLPIGVGSTMLTLGSGPAHYGGLQRIENRDVEFNETRCSVSLANAKRHRLQVLIQLEGADTSVGAWLDRQPLFFWRGPQTALTTPGHNWTLPAPETLGLGAADPTVFHAVRLRMLDGTVRNGIGHRTPPRNVTARVRATLVVLKKSINGIAFSPDGTSIAVGGRDRNATIWDLQGGGQRVSWRSHRRSITGIAFSPDGNKLATGGDSGTVKVWNVATQKMLHNLAGHSSAVASIGFSRDGGRLVSAGRSKETIVWNLADGSQVAKLVDPDASLTCAAPLADADHVVTASGADAIRIWEITAGREKSVFYPGAEITGVALSPDATTLAGNSRADGVVLFDVASGKPLGRFASGPHQPTQVAYTPDGTTIATAGSDGTVRLWDSRSLSQLAKLPVGNVTVRCVAFGPGGDVLAAGFSDGRVRIWDVKFDSPATTAP